MNLKDVISSLWEEEIRWKALGRRRHLRETARQLLTDVRAPRYHIPAQMRSILKGSQGPVGLIPLFSTVAVDHVAISIVSRVITDVYGLPLRLMRSWAPPDNILMKMQNEILSIDGGKLIDHLANSAERSFYKRVLILTDVPIYTQNYGWVLGYAGQKVPIGGISTARYGGYSDPLEALHNVAIHELGHMFGLPHCDVPDCLMNRAGRLNDIMLCDLCIGRLLALKQTIEPENNVPPSAEF